MKPTIDAIQDALAGLKGLQAETTAKASAIQAAINACITAEGATAANALSAEKERHEAAVREIETRHANRTEALQKLLAAVMRLQGDLRDGNDDGAALIAQAFAPPKVRNGDGTPVRDAEAVERAA